MSAPILDIESLRRCLNVRDLTNPAEGPHALQQLVDAVHAALTAARSSAVVRLIRASPIASVADNYDRLGYPPDAIARDARYSRYLCDTALLRTHTTAMIPSVLRELASNPVDELVVVCPGVVYRRDSIDRRHTGEPHQMDVWVLSRGPRLSTHDLHALVATVMTALLPGHARRVSPASHPYTEEGMQIDVREGAAWMEVGECGRASAALLNAHGLPAQSWSGLALGVGLDRALMLRKGLPDIRLLRATDPRVALQMQDLSPYRPVSTMPPVRRDLSLAVDEDYTPEALGDRVREALGAESGVVESVDILTRTPYAELPAAARERIGMAEHQHNLLVRLVLRAYDRTLTTRECNELRNRVYGALHRGTRHQWASTEP